VIANDDFAKDLGVRFGQYTSAHLTNSPTWGVETGDVTVDSAATTTTRQYLVDFPAAPITGTAASFGLAIGKVGTYLLGLELSALQSEGRGEIVASPRVITANQQEAIIKQGVEVAVQGVAGVGAVAVPTFKEAVLELKVTPQITPDDRIIMSLVIKKDNERAGGTGAFERREVKTQVLVDNGETVVLGGVYEQKVSNKVSRVPFFGDLPVVGVLFRNRQEGNAKQELLIFVTPKILQESS
jgi:type IV pilus assembly protein PilQ